MELLENWPYTKLDGIGFDYTYAGLYRFRSGRYDGNATDVVSATALATIRESLEDDLTGFVFVPVSFDSNDWACLVVNKMKKQIIVYDSMNKRKIGKELKLLAREINGRLLEDTLKQTTLTKPRQKDGDSCGVFVCPLFWRQISSAASTDESPEGLVRMRWEMLQALMNQKRSK
ncbi:hypothetical protein PInf_001518 [Phytophthora infestans]|nr:hypothetical protein PInf_001518 [Phytophthora infestans]